MSLSNDITRVLLQMIESQGEAEIRRNDFAQELGCVPSQINYVISSRFTPEHGYIVESRRGGGGYIKITRVSIDSSSAIMHLINSIGTELDALTCRSHIMNLYSAGMLDKKAARLILAATDDASLKTLPPPLRDGLRASILKQCLLVNGKEE